MNLELILLVGVVINFVGWGIYLSVAFLHLRLGRKNVEINQDHYNLRSLERREYFTSMEAYNKGRSDMARELGNASQEEGKQ